MKDPRLKDIRYYEVKPNDFIGVFDGNLGNVYQNADDLKFIGQRIARKLNELEFIAGEFDHLYINLDDNTSENEIIESSKFIDKRIKYIDYGFKAEYFNSLSKSEKESKVQSLTFKVLEFLYGNDRERIRKILDVQNLYSSEMEILYKTLESQSQKIYVSFQIRPNYTNSKLIVRSLNKATEKIGEEIIHLDSYEDIYYLIDSITLKNNTIVFKPKKGQLSELVNAKYTTPLKIELQQMREV